MALYVKSGLEMVSAQSTLFYLSTGSESSYPSSPVLLWMLPLELGECQGWMCNGERGRVCICVCAFLSLIKFQSQIEFILGGPTMEKVSMPFLFSSTNKRELSVTSKTSSTQRL